jgi:hypothetical protein
MRGSSLTCLNHAWHKWSVSWPTRRPASQSHRPTVVGNRYNAKLADAFRDVRQQACRQRTYRVVAPDQAVQLQHALEGACVGGEVRRDLGEGASW